MENRAGLNIHQGPASIAKAELASNAETLEISPPMLDVDPPHEVQPASLSGNLLHPLRIEECKSARALFCQIHRRVRLRN